MAEYVTLVGAEDVGRAGHNIAGAADTITRAAMTIDNAGDHLSRAMDEAVTRFAGNLAEHDAVRPTLRDEFAMAALQGSLSGTPGSHLRPESLARECYLYADEMIKARSA